MKFFDRRQSRLVDEIAIERFGIPGVVLMENAGRNCAEYLLANTHGPGQTVGVVFLLVLQTLIR